MMLQASTKDTVRDAVRRSSDSASLCDFDNIDDAITWAKERADEYEANTNKGH